jgi:hypothetical protein
MFILYFTFVISKHKCAFAVWNPITSANSNELECLQQKFGALFFKHFFLKIHYIYDYALEKLRKKTYFRLSLTQDYLGSKFCPSLLEPVGLRVPARYIRDFSVFNACSSTKSCPARHAAAAEVICKDVDVFGIQTVSLNYILQLYTLIINY